MKTIAIMNQKGGVAKTTTCINLAVQAALKGRTLVIDMDEQANLSRQFGVNEPETTIREALLGEKFSPVNVRENLDLIPSSTDLVGIESRLFNELSRERKLEKALKGIKKDYDFIFIDCPSNTSLVTVNALSCSDYVILPIKAEIFSIEGIDHMINFIRMVRDNINDRLSILGIVITQWDERLNVGKDVMDKIREQKWDTALFHTRIRKNTAVSASQLHHQTIFEYDRKSNGAQDYTALGYEVLERINNHK
ncbi:ParA family protein [Arenibacter sp. 6A1]|uniref:ParA family protein n=1 Tax=Arenibacter sp. 6A1 TaxID=2720391 RepID=UPI0014465F30|nr:ParA family protein [Arenibacter sp. 6A1]NKI28226.1 ParA family protein [Arenibacter sp. 6A1]